MFKQENGFTLAEIVAGVIILMILATVVGLAVFGYIKDARVASLKEEAIAVENDLLTNAGSYDYEGKEASELGEEVRAVLGYHESLDTKMEGLVFEDKALRSEGEIHVGKLSMPESELGNYDFSESGVKKMSGNGIGDEFYVYDELGQVESNVGLLGSKVKNLEKGEKRDWISEGEKRIIKRDGDQFNVKITSNGRYLIWEEEVGSETDIYGMDLKEDEEFIVVSEEGNQFNPDITPDGRYVVWQDERGGDYEDDIYMKDMEEGVEYVVSSATGTQNEPKISGNGRYVTWSDHRQGFSDDSIRLKDMQTGKEVLVNDELEDQYSPEISFDGKYIVWISEITGTVGEVLEGKNLETGEEFIVSDTGEYPDKESPNMSPDGKYVVWTDHNDENWKEVRGKNLETGNEFLVAGGVGHQKIPKISDNGRYVVWENELPAEGPKIYGKDIKEDRQFVIDNGEGYKRGVQITADGRMVVYVSNGSDSDFDIVIQDISNMLGE